MMKWAHVGDVYALSGICTARVSSGRRVGVLIEITRECGFDRLRGGDYVEWSLRVDGDWDETFQRLKDAKLRGEKLIQERCEGIV